MSATTRKIAELPLPTIDVPSADHQIDAPEAARRAKIFKMRRFDRYKLFALTRDRSAVTALEYGLIAAGIAVVIISAVKVLGTNLTATFTAISGHFVNGTIN